MNRRSVLPGQGLRERERERVKSGLGFAVQCKYSLAVESVQQESGRGEIDLEKRSDD